MKILCLQLKRIGDLLLTTPALTTLSEVYPDAEIHVATDSNFSSLFPCIPAHRILPLQHGPLTTWLDLLHERYDICLDFNASDRSSLITSLTRSPFKVTYSRFKKRPFRRYIYHTFVPANLDQRHTADFHLDLLASLGIHREGVPLSIKLPSKAVQTVEELLASLHITSPFVVVHPGTFRPEKYWLNERWQVVIRHLCRVHSLPVCLTGSDSPSEQSHLQSLFIQGEPLLYDLRGKLDLAQLAVLISKAQLLCGVDSAPIHIADAVSTPCVALFGPTNPYQWRPRNLNSRVVGPHPIPYQPIDEGGLMESISTNEVISAIDSLIKS